MVKRRFTSGFVTFRPRPERAVARHPGDDPFARVDDVHVVEPGDVDAVADALGELVDGRVTARDREIERQRAVRLRRAPETRARSIPAVPGALAVRRSQTTSLRDALLDDRDALLRHSLEVERLGQPARVEPVVDQRERSRRRPPRRAGPRSSCGPPGRPAPLSELKPKYQRSSPKAYGSRTAACVPASISPHRASAPPSRPLRADTPPGRARPPSTTSPPRSPTRRRMPRSRAARVRHACDTACPVLDATAISVRRS